MSYLVAIAQLNPTVGDFAANSNAIFDAATQAKAAGAQLLVCPGFALTGAPLGQLSSRGAFTVDANYYAEELSARLQDSFGSDSLPLRVVFGGARLLVPEAGSRFEPRFASCAYLSGSDSIDPLAPVVFSAGAHRFALAYPGRPFMNAALDSSVSAGIYLDTQRFIINGPAANQHIDTGATIAKQLARPLLYSNLVGGNDERVFFGASTVFDSSGGVVTRAREFESDFLVTDLEELLTHVADSVSSSESPVSYPETVSLDPTVFSEAQIARAYRACTVGLHDYIGKNGFSKVVLGLSGGIDSALSAVMAADAIGGENVIGVSMPSQFSSSHSKDDAADSAQRLGADYRVVSISDLILPFSSALTLTPLAYENLQARVRALVLMGISNSEGALVLATGNRSELAVGYSTIYGDAAGGFAPLKDVPKTLVWQMARWRNEQEIAKGGIPPIPESSITKPPSAELRDGQKDSDSLPEYQQLDSLLAAMLDERLDGERLLASGFDRQMVEKVSALVASASWKRKQYPLGPALFSQSFLDIPVTCKWSARLPQQD